MPPLKTYAATYRPGRPKGGAKPPVAEVDKLPPVPREELPHGMALPDMRNSADR